MDLGSTLGVLSWGIGGPPGDNLRYAALFQAYNFRCLNRYNPEE